MTKATQAVTEPRESHTGQLLAYPDSFADAVRRIYANEKVPHGAVFKASNGWTLEIDDKKTSNPR